MTDKIRQYYYLFSGLVGAVVPILITFGVLSANQGNQWNTLVVTFGTLIGAVGSGTAGVVLGRQLKKGTLDPAASPVDQVLNGIPVLIDTAAQAQADLDRVKKVAADAFGSVPGVGPLAKQALDQILPGS
ncbi:hypothetical protein P5W11_09395 [Mycobacteroides abscessus subsp. bolletii]|uniref:hypothetical protein n=1 Tax=Mycobacteroides abscessus TaxID=36809 RepID=UPI00266D0BF3|nr:hypothetical protein [Mycobacteroides abscessus]MDO3068424.1 hypothetical protein [Mycobacteroides abscessus subsp. bolletii]